MSTISPSEQFDRVGVLGCCRPVLAPALLFSCMINLLTATGPLFMIQIFDRVLPSGNLAALGLLITIAGGLLLIMAALDYFRAVMLTRAADWWERTVSTDLLALAATPGRSVSGTSSDIARLRDFLSGTPMTCLLDAPWALLFLGFVFLLHPMLGGLGLAAMLILLVLAILGHLLGRKPAREAIARRQQADGLTGHLDRNANLLRTMDLARNLRKMHSVLLWQAQHTLRSVAESDQIRRSAARFVRAMVQILILGAGAWLVIRGELSGGAMIAASILLGRALTPIEQLVGMLPVLIKARISHAALNELSSTRERSVGPDLPTPAAELSCEHITLPGAPGRPPQLNQIALSVDPGQCVAIMGGSGAGKTLLAELLAGASPPPIGSVRLDGSDLRNWPPQQLGALIGYLPQRPTLFPGTIAQNIARFSPDHDQGDVLRASVAAGVHGLISQLPDGYDTHVDFDSGPLSGGERQRIAFARALFGEPRVLILDEPNASLDKEGERALISSLTHLKSRGVTIVMVAHRAGILSLVDRIVLLDAGRVRDAGPKGEVIARMNARMMQIDLERAPSELPRLEDWVTSHFKRDNDADARATAAMVAAEMFNISLVSAAKSDAKTPIRFTIKHRRGSCTISMHDTCTLISSARLDRLRRIAGDEFALAPPLEGADLALLMVIQLSRQFDQKAADYGRVMQSEIATPVHEGDDVRAAGVLN